MNYLLKGIPQLIHKDHLCDGERMTSITLINVKKKNTRKTNQNQQNNKSLKSILLKYSAKVTRENNNVKIKVTIYSVSVLSNN